MTKKVYHLFVGKSIPQRGLGNYRESFVHRVEADWAIRDTKSDSVSWIVLAVTNPDGSLRTIETWERMADSEWVRT